jgi:hypothetical protein
MIAEKYIWMSLGILYMVKILLRFCARLSQLFRALGANEEPFDPEEEMMRIMACDDNKHEVIIYI